MGVKRNRATVQWVVDKLLCTGCGTCAGICPKDAITMEIDKYGIYSPIIEFKDCNSCGLCMKVCPGHEFDYPYFYKAIHGLIPENGAIGAFIDCYSGFTTDHDMLEQTQSGGFVSTAFIYGLENRLYHGVVVTKWNELNPFRPITYIAQNRDEVLMAVGSKYNPVPTNIILKKILEKDGVFAFVGTSCQIQGMRKAEILYPKLKTKIGLYIGLHCLKVFNYYYHDQILHKIKVNKKDVSNFRFRDKKWRGWPCDMRIVKIDGKEYNLTGPESRLWARSYFSNWRCQLCFDKFNEFSDISCGDCRVPEQYGVKKLSEISYKTLGQSDIIVRTTRGKEYIEKLLIDGCLSVKKSNYLDIIRTVRIAEKKLGLNDYKMITRVFRLGFPNYNIKFRRSRKDTLLDFLLQPYSILASTNYYFTHVLMQYKFYRWLLKITPHKLLGEIEKVRERHINHIRHGDETDIVITLK